MKKLFLLIPALVLSLAINAKEIEVASGTSNIIHYTIANAATEDGDVLVLTDAGPYISTAGSDDYTKLVKNLTIKAADGIDPVVKLEVPFRSSGGKSVKFIGITFDGTSLTSYDFYFRFYDNADNLEFEDCEFKNISKYIFDVYTGKNANSLKLTNCKLHDNSSRGILNRGTLANLEINGGEIYNFTGYPVVDNYDGATLGNLRINGTEFYGNTKDIISGTATSHADSCIINNCYFHNNSRSAVYFAASTVSGVETCDGVIVKNSTFANNDLSGSSRSVIEVQNYGAAETSNIEVTVDHCTFYNNTTVNYDYSCVRSRKSTKVSITNSIFAYPSAIEFYATNCYGGTISNNLIYNLSKGHRSSGGAPAIANAITGNPLFNDLANNKYTFAGDWSTGSISPARGAATDGSDLGDPRWYSAEVLPETDFASPYVLTGDKAKLTGRVATDASNYLKFNNNKDVSQHGVAIWKVRATRSCNLQATLNIDTENGSGHRYQIEVFDSNNTLIGTAIGESANSWDKGDKVISDLITLSEAGDYKIKLSNLCDDSGNLLHSITLSYVGGAVVPVSPTVNTTLNIEDALFSGCTRDAIGIAYPSSGTSSAWIKWNISTSSTASYDIIVNINTEYAHGFTVAVYEDESAAPVASVTEGSYINTKGDGLALDLGTISLAGGKNYVVKVSNAPSGSQAKVLNLVFAPAVSSTINLPNSLPLTSAVTSSSSMVGIDGDQMYFSPDPSHQNSKDQWAQWSVHVSEAASYLCSMDVTSTNDQSYKISILNGSNEEICVYEKNPGSGNKTLKQYFYLPIGDYTVRVTSTYSWSAGRLVSIEFTKPANVITLDDNADNSAVISANKNGGEKNIQLIRTLKGGVFNTLCLPFKVHYSKAPEIFGTGVEIYTLKSTTLVDATLDVEFETSSGIYQGTPVLIKPVKDVVNPFFEGVEILADAPATSISTYTNFVGTFIPTSIEASPNNIFLGPNNTLYFPENTAQPIRGMRGWFVLHDAPAGIIQRARIVTQSEEVTAIDLVGAENNDAQKVFVNGQLIIIKDGVQYNVMGVKLQ